MKGNTLVRATQKTFRWMLEPTVNNCPKKLRFQEKVSEARTVYPNITPAIAKKLKIKYYTIRERNNCRDTPNIHAVTVR